MSGYIVPCARNFIPSSLRASSSNTRMNSAPITLRFVSGSATPASLSRKRSTASTYVRFAPSWFLNTSMTCSLSPLRIRPWFTCTHSSCLPTALMSSAATTDESTPPDSASSTLPSPICARSASTCSAMNFSASSGVVIRSISGLLFPSILITASNTGKNICGE